jgi:hypothetical protein
MPDHIFPYHIDEDYAPESEPEEEDEEYETERSPEPWEEQVRLWGMYPNE